MNRSVLARCVPERVAWPLYLGAARLITSGVWLKEASAEAWARNSVAIGPLQFGLSDIDITVVVEDLAQKQRLESYFRRMPLVAEVNWYARDNVERTLSWMNPIELKRDPNLKFWAAHHLRWTPSSITNEHRLAFLLRMFKACISQFQGRIPWQHLKWVSYFELAELNKAPRDREAFFQAVNQLAFACGIAQPIDPVLRSTVSMEERKVPLHIWAEELGDQLALAATLFPHHLCFLDPRPENIYPEVRKAQLEWELWGMETQFCGKLNREQTDHLRKVELWCAGATIGL